MIERAIEKLRITLLHWNIAPLSIVVFLCFLLYQLQQFFMSTACTDKPMGDATTAVVFSFMGGLVTALGMMYKSMQRNRKEDDNDVV
jgi:hypothetical protein